MTSLENHFYREMLEKLRHALQSEGYHVLVLMAQQDADHSDEVVTEILGYLVDRIILTSVGTSSDLVLRCQAVDVPLTRFSQC